VVKINKKPLVCSVSRPLQAPKDKTSVVIPQYTKLTENAICFFMGSCFGEEMHVRIAHRNHESASNPFGVIFHPNALCQNVKLIEKSSHSDRFSTALQSENMYQHQGIYHSLQHANRFQNTDRQALEESIFSAALQARKHIQQAHFIAITLGTAWIYRHLPTNSFVGNCHKLPQQDFQKSLTSHIDLKTQIQGIIDHLRLLNTTAQIVFTVSPVRHLRDGVSENLLSKSALISALHEVLSDENQKGNAKTVYFPAYEMIREELNDWRYYKEDKMHPTDEAINTVFERFYNSFFSTKDSTFSAVL
jgi:hypothetical protein